MDREAEIQRQFVIRTKFDNEARVDRLLMPLARKSVPMCNGKERATFGVRLLHRHAWPREYWPALLSLGVSDTLTVVGVSPGSNAEGKLRVRDRILQMEGTRIRTGKAGYEQVQKLIAQRVERGDSAVTIHFDRRSAADSLPQVDSVEVVLETLCSGRAEVVQTSDINAFADGRIVYVTTGMLRFASDAELQTVLAHEIAHNAARHIEAKQKNAGWGALLGAVLDVAAASQGVNTGGQFTNDFAALGAMSFSQDFEREADYIGSYILAAAGLSTEHAADFWRRMAAESPGSIKFGSSHPTSTERFLRLSQYHTEIEQKRRDGVPLMPTPKAK